MSRVVYYKMISVHLKHDGTPYRAHHSLGIYELEDAIVFLHSMLGDVTNERVTKDTIFPKYIISDLFTLDFTKHTQNSLVYSDEGTLLGNCCKCTSENQKLFLNTMYYKPIDGGVTGDSNRHNTLAKLIEIRTDALIEISESPAPITMEYCETKTYTFGDYQVHMISAFTMECRLNATNTVVWKLRLSAYLYTEIEEKNGKLYFGTAAKGGYFYSISLQDGKIIFEYNTGGTTNYVWYEGNVLMVDKKGDIILLDSKIGTLIKRYTLRRSDSSKQRLQATPDILVKDDKIYSVAISRENFYEFYAVCVDL